MEQQKNEPKLMNKLFSGSGWALFTMFVWELVEEGLENLIAIAISGTLALFITKALSTLTIITATQGIKVAIKRFLSPIVKELTYKEGKDKMTKIKQFFVWVYANKKSLLGVGASAVGVMSGSGLIDVSSLPVLTAFGINVTPLIYYACLACLAILGICGKGFEKIEDFFARIKVLKEDKEQAKLEKEAKKELDAEKKQEKLTNEEKEKKEAKEQAEKLKAEEKEKSEAEHRAKIDAIKEKLKAEETSNG